MLTDGLSLATLIDPSIAVGDGLTTFHQNQTWKRSHREY